MPGRRQIDTACEVECLDDKCEVVQLGTVELPGSVRVALCGPPLATPDIRERRAKAERIAAAQAEAARTRPEKDTPRQ